MVTARSSEHLLGPLHPCTGEFGLLFKMAKHINEPISLSQL